jgi:hypothetical protein
LERPATPRGLRLTKVEVFVSSEYSTILPVAASAINRFPMESTATPLGLTRLMLPVEMAVGVAPGRKA